MSTGGKGGLEGIVAGRTALCTVGKEGVGLTYRGYTIEDLATLGTFEETAYLLLYGKLPTKTELSEFQDRLLAHRALPPALARVLEEIPQNTHPMDVLRTACSMLGCLEPEVDFADQYRAAERLLACMPSCLLYWYRFHSDSQRIDVRSKESSIAGQFLHLLHDRPPSELHQRAMDVSLILYAEHEFNASTFTAGSSHRLCPIITRPSPPESEPFVVHCMVALMRRPWS